MQAILHRYLDINALSIGKLLDLEIEYACTRSELLTICVATFNDSIDLVRLLHTLDISVLEEYLFWCQLYIAKPCIKHYRDTVYGKLLVSVLATEEKTHQIQKHQELFRQKLTVRIQESQDCITEVWQTLLELDGFREYYTKILDRDEIKFSQNTSTKFNSVYLNLDQLMIRKKPLDKITVNIETSIMDGHTDFRLEQIERFKQLVARENRFKTTKAALH